MPDPTTARPTAAAVVARWLVDYLSTAGTDTVDRAKLRRDAPNSGTIHMTGRPAGRSHGARSSRHLRDLLQAFERAGLIRRTDHEVTILDRDGLRRWHEHQGRQR